MTTEPPQVFMSYSHDSEEHRDWVLQLSHRLRSNGVDVCLDRWNVSLGGNLAHYMERAADQKYRVIAVVSENYSRKCNDREGGAGVEGQMLSARLFADLDSNAVIPIIRNNPGNPPALPAFLGGRMYEDFREDASQEDAYERLLREIHGVPVDAAPPLGPNPLEGRTAVEASLEIRNSQERWHNPATRGDVEFVYSQNSGKYKLGSGTAQFTLEVGECGLGIVYVYRDPADIANVAVVNRARERTELLADVSEFDTSSRHVNARAGDAVVLHNGNGFWALVYITKIHAREALNRELVINFRFEIQLDRTADFSGFKFPDSDAPQKSENQTEHQ
ncbi:toll/interleukin-1 receptor domain-containing protein [Mycolicibacillus trivialis]